MEWFTTLNWETMFVSKTSLPELLIRGSLVYLALVALFRVALNRQTGTVAVTDLMLIIIIGESVQNALIGENFALIDGLVVVCVLLFWDFAINWLGYHVPFIGKLIAPPPLPLVKRGRMIRKNMKRELITKDELMSQLRLQGVDSLVKVKHACIESDGKMSVVMFEEGESHPEPEDGVAH